MRAVLVMLMTLILCAPIAAPAWAGGDGPALVASGQQPEGKVDVNVDLDRGGSAWYTNPVWIAIGVIALIVLVLLIVMATRGGTTVIKE